MKRNLIVLLAVLSVFAWVPMAPAAQIGNFSIGTSGVGHAAQAVFDLTGTTLTIDLFNLGQKSNDPTDVLTAIFFCGSTITGITPTSATASQLFDITRAGSPPVNTTTLDGSNVDVGTHWEWLATTQYGGTQGISSAGFGIFGSGNFATPGVQVDGLEYGIANGFTDGGTTGINPTGNATPLADNEMVFMLTVPADFTVDCITFQYGTALSDFHQTVPLPPSVLLMGSGLLGLGLVGWRRRTSCS